MIQDTQLYDYLIIFTQKVKCRKVQEIYLYTRDPKKPAKGLVPTAVSLQFYIKDLHQKGPRTNGRN